MHPYLLLDLANQHHRDLAAAATGIASPAAAASPGATVAGGPCARVASVVPSG
ncbi:MAG TPA: hypothetical protein VG929_00705 [Actinomycetota bacterium]|nr:hypothetical protein [Actinomycetota bacterium]